MRPQRDVNEALIYIYNLKRYGYLTIIIKSYLKYRQLGLRRALNYIETKLPELKAYRLTSDYLSKELDAGLWAHEVSVLRFEVALEDSLNEITQKVDQTQSHKRI